MIRRLSTRLSYSNVVGTLALFVALGGTSFAVSQIGSEDVADNSLRSRDVRNNTVRGADIRDQSVRARDVARNALGSGVIRESALGLVPRAGNAQRVGGLTADDLKLRCPPGTILRASACIESAPRLPTGFLIAIDVCDQAGRGLVSMPQLDRFARVNGPLPAAEWTASVYRNPANGPTSVEQLEAVVLGTGGEPSYDRVYLAVQHAFRCVALPSN